MRTPGWKGNRVRMPVVQVRPVCGRCGNRLTALSPGDIPVRAGEDPHGEVRTISRHCKCGHVTRIKVVSA